MYVDSLHLLSEFYMYMYIFFTLAFVLNIYVKNVILVSCLHVHCTVQCTCVYSVCIVVISQF